jgi:hypothetical protein
MRLVQSKEGLEHLSGLSALDVGSIDILNDCCHRVGAMTLFLMEVR